MSYIDFFEKRELPIGSTPEFPLDIHLDGGQNSCLVIDENKKVKHITEDCYVYVPLILDEDELETYAAKLFEKLPLKKRLYYDNLICIYRDNKYGLCIFDTRKI